MTATIIPIDRRSQQVIVSRATLSHAAENALAAHRTAAEAVERASRHIFAGNRAAAIHELGRAGFELQESTGPMATLAAIAESAPTYCPDAITDPGHGRAA